jgi:hypothetical protein
MRKYNIFAPAIAASFIAASQGASADTSPSSHPQTRSALSISSSTGCQKLLSESCEGSGKRLEWRSTDSGLGTTVIGLESYQERIGNPLFNYSVSGKLGAISAHAAWSAGIQGTRLTLDQAFKIKEHSQIELGGFLGRIEADATIQSHASIQVHPRSLAVPELNYGGYHFPATSLEYKGHQYSAMPDWNRKKSSADAGLRFATGTAFSATEHLRAGLSTFGQMSLARTSYGAGAALYYSSSADHRLGTEAGGLCSGRPLLSSARFAFAAGICAQQIQKDRLMDAKIRQAQRLSDRVNTVTGQIDEYLDRAREHLPNGSGLPSVATSYTATDAAKLMGLRYDYKAVSSAFVLGTAVRLGNNAVLSLTHRHDKYDPRTDLSVTWTFK